MQELLTRLKCKSFVCTVLLVARLALKLITCKTCELQLAGVQKENDHGLKTCII